MATVTATSDFQYVSVPEAAVQLELTDGRIRQLIREHRLQAHKVGKDQWAIPVLAVEEYRQSRRGPGRPRKD
jgi:excisionase family DNA binding protein